MEWQNPQETEMFDNAIPLDYGVDMTTNKINGFAKIDISFQMTILKV